MIISEEKLKELDALTDPLIEWLNNNCHPHVTLIIDPGSVELLEGVCRLVNEEHWRD